MNESSDEDDSDSRTAHKPTVEEYALYYLYDEARPLTVNEVATGIDYSHGYTRKALKRLRARGLVEGQKTTPIVGCTINGQLIVLTSNREAMIEALEKCAPPLAARARAENMTVEEIHALIKANAQGTAILERRWVFWYPEPDSGDPSSSGTAEAASAD